MKFIKKNIKWISTIFIVGFILIYYLTNNLSGLKKYQGTYVLYAADYHLWRINSLQDRCDETLFFGESISEMITNWKWSKEWIGYSGSRTHFDGKKIMYQEGETLFPFIGNFLYSAWTRKEYDFSNFPEITNKKFIGKGDNAMITCYYKYATNSEEVKKMIIDLRTKPLKRMFDKNPGFSELPIMDGKGYHVFQTGETFVFGSLLYGIRVDGQQLGPVVKVNSDGKIDMEFKNKILYDLKKYLNIDFPTNDLTDYEVGGIAFIGETSNNSMLVSGYDKNFTPNLRRHFILRSDGSIDPKFGIQFLSAYNNVVMRIPDTNDSLLYRKFAGQDRIEKLIDGSLIDENFKPTPKDFSLMHSIMDKSNLWTDKQSDGQGREYVREYDPYFSLKRYLPDGSLDQEYPRLD
ncbi:hypothetical protein KA050_04230 [Candidatus Gracilibacteria bacterium]|nr:hypothetical protein [Candidatus Gracilibacteria bacterium]